MVAPTGKAQARMGHQMSTFAYPAGRPSSCQQRLSAFFFFCPYLGRRGDHKGPPDPVSTWRTGRKYLPSAPQSTYLCPGRETFGPAICSSGSSGLQVLGGGGRERERTRLARPLGVPFRPGPVSLAVPHSAGLPCVPAYVHAYIYIYLHMWARVCGRVCRCVRVCATLAPRKCRRPWAWIAISHIFSCESD